MPMKPQCHDAVQQAAAAAGLPPRTTAQIDAIDARLRSTMRRLARDDPEWQSKSAAQRLQAAAEQGIADVHAAAARKVELAQMQALATAGTESRISDAVARGDSRSHALVGDIEDTAHYVTGIKNETMGQLLSLMDAVRSFDGASAGRRVVQFLFDADNPVMRRDLANEIFGNADGSTGNAAAKEGARAYLDVAEKLRQRFNAAGGDIGQLDYGYLRQPWQADRLRQAGVDKFVEVMTPLVNRSRLLREDGAPMGDGEVRDFLRSSFETLSTEGLNKREPGEFRTGSARANRGSDHREIHFQNGEAWLAAMQEFGRGSMYEAIGSHVTGLARDIGLVERYGPNPNAQFKLQLDLAEHADRAVDRTFLMRPETYWDVLTGVTATPQNAKIATLGANARAIQTGGKLGGAVISSITDVGTFVVTTGYNKLPYWDALANVGKAAFSKDARDFMTTHGIIAEQMAGDLNRWTGDQVGQTWAGRLANSTLKLSLLNAWTDTLRRGFQLTMMQGLARMAKTDWADLSAFDRHRMETHGLTADDWAVMRQAELTAYGGKDHMTPEAIRGTGDARAGEVVAKVLGLIQDEGEYAVLNPDLATKAATTFGGTQSGTIRGELARSVMQFKAFPLAMVSRHWRRMLDTPQGARGRAGAGQPRDVHGLAHRLDHGARRDRTAGEAGRRRQGPDRHARRPRHEVLAQVGGAGRRPLDRRRHAAQRPLELARRHGRRGGEHGGRPGVRQHREPRVEGRRRERVAGRRGQEVALAGRGSLVGEVERAAREHLVPQERDRPCGVDGTAGESQPGLPLEDEAERAQRLGPGLLVATRHRRPAARA